MRALLLPFTRPTTSLCIQKTRPHAISKVQLSRTLIATTTTTTTTRTNNNMSENDALTKDAVFNHNNTVPPPKGKIMPRFSLKGKTAIVAGAGAGIGLQVARGYAEAGANVAIWYNSNKSALDRAAEIEKEFGVKGEFSGHAD